MILTRHSSVTITYLMNPIITDPTSLFRPGSRLGQVLPTYEYRPQQEEMASHVWHALTTGSNLAIEAGTGIGKSLAYLVPAVTWVIKTRKRVAVSTYTRLLQSQLINQDIPLVRKLIPDLPKVAVAYGQENYLCRFRLRSRLARGLFDTRQEAATASRLLDWAETTTQGILLNYPHPLPAKLWHRICRDPTTCRRNDCPYFSDCFYYRARRNWEKSAMLIVNHSLFFAGLAAETELLPKMDAVIFDEANRLEDACVRHFGIRVSQRRLSQILDYICPVAGRGLIHALAHQAGIVENIEKEVGFCRNELLNFFQETESLLGPDAIRLRLKQPLQAVPVSALNRLSASLNKTARDADDEHLASELKGTARKLEDTANSLTEFMDLDTENAVQWVERTGANNINLISAPLDIAHKLKELVYPGFTSTIMTSATLTVADEFGFISSRLGLDRFKTLQLDSPFDHGHNSLLFVANKIPPPNHPDFNQAGAKLIQRILKASHGRALVLFTSYDMMNRVRNLIPQHSYTHLYQGELPVAQLLQQFRNDTHSVLFATQSFWQGIDVPGESLTCLIICRLPFEVPDDPRLTAIAEQLRKQRIDPFNTYQVPTAVLRFRQGFGRLIRTKKDRGVVCVLDRRILDRGYGNSFLKSLPKELPLTTSFNQVVRFLRKVDNPDI